ncbi:Protein SRT-41 [Aphelenchoides avenae]|nr:Protein SRT-41 [Aphelenchus avenae]
MLTSVILAINRCTLFVSPQLSERLFAGRRTYVWLLIPVSMSFAFLFFPPLMYNGVAFAYVANPHLGYYDDATMRYTNMLHLVNNLFVSFAVPAIYLCFTVLLCRYAGGLKSLIGHREFSSFIQVLIISILTAVPSVIYVYFQVFPCPPIVAIMCTFGWFCIQGFPAIIYLSMNRSIRTAVIRSSKVLPHVGLSRWSQSNNQEVDKTNASHQTSQQVVVRTMDVPPTS